MLNRRRFHQLYIAIKIQYKLKSLDYCLSTTLSSSLVIFHFFIFNFHLFHYWIRHIVDEEKTNKCSNGKIIEALMGSIFISFLVFVLLCLNLDLYRMFFCCCVLFWLCCFFFTFWHLDLFTPVALTIYRFSSFVFLFMSKIRKFKTDGNSCFLQRMPFSICYAWPHGLNTPAISNSLHMSSPMANNRLNFRWDRAFCVQWSMVDYMLWSRPLANTVNRWQIAKTNVALRECSCS